MSKPKEQRTIQLGRHELAYRLVQSTSAKRLRLRVGISGIEVIQPRARNEEDAREFLQANEVWVLHQWQRIARFRNIRKTPAKNQNEILYRGQPTTVLVREAAHWQGANQVQIDDQGLVILKSSASLTPPQKTLENWLRKQARAAIEQRLAIVTTKLNRTPQKVYVRGQRTKWGSCSARQNLSFNWRLIMAPDYVLNYLVTHEAVHLAVPDHSKKFWLTVQSLCPETERAKQWLAAQGHKLLEDFPLPSIAEQVTLVN